MSPEYQSSFLGKYNTTYLRGSQPLVREPLVVREQPSEETLFLAFVKYFLTKKYKLVVHTMIKIPLSGTYHLWYTITKSLVTSDLNSL
jgi:hypothetical protein